MPVAECALSGITKRFAEVTALDDVSFTVEDRSLVILLGPTGAGKTTTLRVVAGVERPESGEVRLGGERVNELSPALRDVALVSQHYALYPHFTVYENLAFPLRPRRLSRAEIDARVRATAQILHIDHLLDRKPEKLSGGEQQRVAIGRAMVRTPRLFLLDEPLSNLDAKLREEMRAQLKRLQREIGATMLFVTHDQVEAMSMGDRIVVLDRGIVQQIGTPAEVFTYPANLFVARFVGSPGMNLLEAAFDPSAPAEIRFPGVEAPLAISEPSRRALAEGLAGNRVTVGIRPSDLELGPSPGIAEAEREGLVGTVYVIETAGAHRIVNLRFGSQTLKALVPRHTPCRVGESRSLTFPEGRLRFFDPVSGRRLAEKGEGGAA